MTAEVAIVTKTAVAVAADSAVTVGETKVHRSTTKIFTITQDIAAMVYGYSELAGMPWEVLLKLFRAEHSKDQFPTVDACYEALRLFLDEERFKLENGGIESLVRFSIEVIEYVKGRVEAGKKPNLKSILSAIDAETRDYYINWDDPINFSSPTIDVFAADATSMIELVVDEVFSDIKYKVPRSTIPKFVELVYRALNSSFLSEYASGLVVFGFGTDDLFPQLHETVFDSVPFGIIRSRLRRKTNAIDDGAGIYPLAEREVMDTVIQGITGHLQEVAVEAVSVIANEVAARIIEDNLPQSEHLVSIALAKRLIRDVVRDFDQTFDDYIGGSYVWEMVDTIENMPKEDIAVLAEALVEITALRIKSSADIESVAGPVDVCVITKGDGLIWIKRKHYFDLNRNLQYLYRRYGGASPAIPMDGGSDGEG